jgi:hypothetical protein
MLMANPPKAGTMLPKTRSILPKNSRFVRNGTPPWESPDLAVDIETCVAPAEDLLDGGKADELFLKLQGKDLMDEDLLDGLVMETIDSVENLIRA